MKTINLFINILLLSTNSFSQEPIFDWGFGTGGNQPTFIEDSSFDSEGNVYNIGQFLDTIDFDPGIGVSNYVSNPIYTLDFFIQKISSNGEFLWLKKIGGSAVEVGYEIEIDANDNLLITGWFEGNVDFSGGNGTHFLQSNGGRDVFILKLDQDGNTLWAKNIGSSNSNSSDEGTCIAYDLNNNVYVSGIFNGTIDLDPGIGVQESTANNRGCFVLKLDSDGDFIWAKSIAGWSLIDARSIAVDINENVTITGDFRFDTDFDPGVNEYILTGLDNYRSIFEFQLDSMGLFNWAHAFPPIDSNQIGRVIDTDEQGNIYSLSSFFDPTDFDPGSDSLIITPLYYGIILRKLDSMGNLIWYKLITASGQHFADDLQCDNNGNVYVATTAQGQINLDYQNATDSIDPPGESNLFVQKFNSQGELIWHSILESSEETIVSWTNLNVSYQGDILLSGTTSPAIGEDIGELDLDPGPDQSLWETDEIDFFCVKLNPCASEVGLDIRTECVSYEWIDGQIYTESNNEAMYSIPGGAFNGCDSIVSLDLTIIPVDTSISQNGNILTSNALNADYQWLDCSDNFASIVGEIGQDFTPSEDGMYALMVEQNGCVDTSSCLNFTLSGILENTFGKVNIYPNPTSDNITIELDKNYSAIQLNVYSSMGQLLYSKDVYNKTLFDLNMDYSKGIYFVELIAEEQKGVFKVIKE